MKRTIAVVGLLASLASLQSVSAMAAPKPRPFANCQSLNAVYPYGVSATPVAADAMASALFFRPTTNKSVYNLNIRLDSPRNGAVCEVALPKSVPSTVIGLQVISTTTDRVDLAWQIPVSSGNSPIISYVVAGTGGAATVSGTTAVVTGLTPGSNYTFQVSAVNAVGVGAAAAIAAATKPAAVAIAPAAPAAPAGAAKYANCTAAKEAGVTPIRRDTNPSLYAANSGLDRDKDGVACEQ